MKLHVSTPWGHLQYTVNIHPRPTHGQSDNRSQDKYAT